MPGQDKNCDHNIFSLNCFYYADTVPLPSRSGFPLPGEKEVNVDNNGSLCQHVAGQHSSVSKVEILKEGYLFKRQRGHSSKADLTKLKFQQRYICLTQDSLHYYRGNKLIVS